MRDLLNMVRALGFLTRELLDDRAAFARDLRACGSSVLDARFARGSRIPDLDRVAVSLVMQHDVLLPPGAWFQRANQNAAGLIFLVSLAKTLRARSIFEIGTYNGLTAYTLASNLPEATIYTLDLPVATEPALPLFIGDELHLPSQAARLHERRETPGRIVQLEGDSALFDYSSYEGCCEVVYVDGAHSRDYVVSDSDVAFRLASSCSAIVWDDYTRGITGVAEALDALAATRQLFRVPGTRLVVHITNGAREIMGRS